MKNNIKIIKSKEDLKKSHFWKSFNKLSDYKENWTSYLFVAFGLIQIALTILFTYSDSFGFPIKSDKHSGLKNVFGDFGSTFYFTNISNYFLGITMLFLGINKHYKTKNFFIIAMSYMTITVILYWLLISWKEKSWLDNPFTVFRNLWVHLFSYGLGITTFILIRKNVTNYKTTTLISSQIFIVCWYVFALIIFFVPASKNFFFYNFLDFKNPFYYKGGNSGLVLIINIIIIILLFLLPILFNWGLIFTFKIKRVKNIKIKNKLF